MSFEALRDAALASLSGAEAGTVSWPPATRGNEAAQAFYADLAPHVAQGADAFAWRALAVQVGLYARWRGVALQHAPLALLSDAPALKEVFASWRETLRRALGDDGAGWDLDEARRACVEDGLLSWAHEPEAMRRFLATGGYLRAPRPQPCPAPFQPKVVSWHERREAQSAWMSAHFAANRPGLYVNNAEPSISKTGAALQLMATHRDSRFLYLAPSHALLLDVRERALALGIPAEEIFVAQGLERLCSYADGVQTVARDARRGLDFKRRYCRDGGLCGRQASCAWHVQKQLGREARILLAPSAYLASESHFSFLLSPAWGNDQRDAVFVDEDAVDRLCVRQPLPSAALLRLADLLAGVPGAVGAYREAIARHLAHLGAFATDDAAQRLELPPAPPVPDGPAWARERRAVQKLIRQQAPEDDLVLELLGALDMLVCDPAPRPIYKDGRGDAYAFELVPPLPAKPIFFLDGTAVPDYYRLALAPHGEPTFLLPEPRSERRDFIQPAGRIIQIVDAPSSRTRLRSAAPMEALVSSVRAFVQRRRTERPTRRTLLITYMDRPDASYEGRFRAELQGLGVEVAHYGSIRGLDAFAGWDVVVVGAHRLAPEAYTEAALTLLGAEQVVTGTRLSLEALPTLESTSYAVPVDHFCDPALRLVFEQKTLGELAQAVARSRVLVPGHEDVMVVAYTNLPLPGLLVEPMTRERFDALNAGQPQGAAQAGVGRQAFGDVEAMVRRALALKAAQRKQA